MIPAVRPWCAAILLVLAAAGGAAGVDDGDDDPNAVRDPSYVAARQALRGRQYADAIRLLSDVLARDPRDADTHNLLGFAYRKSGISTAPSITITRRFDFSLTIAARTNTSARRISCAETSRAPRSICAR